jgi:hypothetical protein
MIKTQKVEDGFVVSDSGTWLPGCYDSKATAEFAATLPDDKLAALDRSRTLTMEDLKCST